MYIVIRAMRVITVFNEIYHVELIMCLLSGSGTRGEISKLINSITIFIYRRVNNKSYTRFFFYIKLL